MIDNDQKWLIGLLNSMNLPQKEVMLRIVKVASLIALLFRPISSTIVITILLSAAIGNQWVVISGALATFWLLYLFSKFYAWVAKINLKFFCLSVSLSTFLFLVLDLQPQGFGGGVALHFGEKITWAMGVGALSAGAYLFAVFYVALIDLMAYPVMDIFGTLLQKTAVMCMRKHCPAWFTSISKKSLVEFGERGVMGLNVLQYERESACGVFGGHENAGGLKWEDYCKRSGAMPPKNWSKLINPSCSLAVSRRQAVKDVSK